MSLTPAPEAVSQRLKDQFAPTYLTLASIIQGVALAAFVARVEATYLQFSTTDWVVTITTFIGVLAVWNEYLMQILAYVWMPKLFDSLIPFAFLVCELFLVHFIYHDLHAWLLFFALIFIVGVVAQILTNTQARALPSENRDIIRTLADNNKIRGLLSVIIVIFTLCVWAFYDALKLDRAQLTIALIALIVLIGYITTSIPYWNDVLSYAQGKKVFLEEKKID